MERCDVVISGGGPVGLLLGCLLAKKSLDVRVLEASDEGARDSRAIGIHPPGLGCLEPLGVVDEFVKRGVQVQRGRAFAHGRQLGSITFSDTKAGYPFVLSLPQSDTEQVLEHTLSDMAPEALRRRSKVRAVRAHRGFCRVDVDDDQGSRTLHARFAVACDGKRSVLRDDAGIDFEGGAYAKRFLMADTRDDTPFGPEAAIFLHKQGLVESFPLPKRKRRWVASVSDTEGGLAHLKDTVMQRTGFELDAATVSSWSAFTAEHYLARRLVRGPLVLAGDAAHIVSPIGGQGMNLGWQDARALSDILLSSWRHSDELARRLSVYERERIRAAQAARRRAELFMTLGTSGDGVLTRFAMRTLLAPWWHRTVARAFTMGGR
jgi:2-polyprenyl-6-methoxyphenol hydroxylase-like FAD-dependent oxidoreductase